MKKVLRKILSITIATSVVMACFVTTAFAATTPIGVSYSGQVQNVGWMAAVTDGTTAGTSGQSLRLESLKIALTGTLPAGAGIVYQAHVQNKGWMSYQSNGSIAGTVGESLRMEAIAIGLTNLPGYTVQYKVHIQDIGWTSWKTDGQIAGTVGQSKRIEAIQIKIVAPTVLAVASVSAINSQEVQVVFNKPVDKNTISDSDISFTSLDFHSVAFVGTLSSDGLTYSLSTVVSGDIFKGRYDVAIDAGTIVATSGEGIAKYSATLNFSDTLAPSIVSVSAKPNGSANDVVIKFSEPVDDAGILTVNGTAYYTYTPSIDGKTATFTGVALTAGIAYAAQLVGAVDRVGNVANPLSFSVTSIADVTKPTVTISAKDATITLTFSETIAAPPVVTVNTVAIAATVDASNDKIYTVDTTAYLASLSTTFLNGASVKVASFVDLSANAGSDTTASVNLKTDTVAPVLVSKALVNNKLELKFDEAIDAVNGNIALSFVNASGVVVPLSATTFTYDLGKDLNGSGIIDNGTDEVKYVVVTITDTLLYTDSNLKAGTYTFSWVKGVFLDAASNQVAAASFSLTPTTSTSLTADVAYEANTNTGSNSEIFVQYYDNDTNATVAMGSSALVISNYKVGGAALPVGTVAVFFGDTTLVRLTLPTGSITANGWRTLVVSNVVAASGNTLYADIGPVMVPLTENVRPLFSAIAINSISVATATFSENLDPAAVVAGKIIGVTVKVGGVADDGATLAVSGNTVVITTSVVLSASSIVTLSFSSTVLSDLNGNTVADN